MIMDLSGVFFRSLALDMEFLWDHWIHFCLSFYLVVFSCHLFWQAFSRYLSLAQMDFFWEQPVESLLISYNEMNLRRACTTVDFF